MRLFFEKIKRYIIQIKLLLIRDGWKKAKWLKNKKIFGKIGEHCYYAPNILPPEPFLIQIHNNVVISANVRLITHSGVHSVFNYEEKTNKYTCPHGKVEIKDNVYIGANATINYGVTIGNNCIIAAGVMVTKNVPDGEVWGGVPAKKIGLYEDVKRKANLRDRIYNGKADGETPVYDLIKIEEKYEKTIYMD